MPGHMDDDHLWEQTEVDWPDDERRDLAWARSGLASRAWSDPDPRSLEEILSGIRERPGTVRKPWEVDSDREDRVRDGADGREEFGWNGDHEWAVTRWANPKYL